MDYEAPPAATHLTKQPGCGLQLVSKKEELVAISTEASQEAGLEGMLHRWVRAAMPALPQLRYCCLLSSAR